MKIFLSWSGAKSKKVAILFDQWIRQVIQAVDPWISTDIEKGVRWSAEISKSLSETKVGIICLTKDNLKSEWILFESGAISKTEDAIVCTFLLDITPTDITPPLSLFQCTKFEKEDIRRLVITINNRLSHSGQKSIHEKTLDSIFEKFYPDLEEGLIQIKNEDGENLEELRTDRELLEEILETVRRIGISAKFEPSGAYMPTSPSSILSYFEAAPSAMQIAPLFREGSKSPFQNSSMHEETSKKTKRGSQKKN